MPGPSNQGLRALVPAPLQPAARRLLVRYRHRGLRPTDAVLVSYPKSGSTWLRFLLGHVLAGREIDFDSVRQLVAPIGRHGRAPALLPSGGRFLRTHEPLSRFHGRPGQPIVYLVRDPHDIVVSYFHHMQRTGEVSDDPSEFVRLVLADRVDPYGTWWDHALGAHEWQLQQRSPFLLVRYEDLRRDTVSELARILGFVGVDEDAALTQRIGAAVEANTKERMREKEASSSILRSQRANDVAFVRPEGGPGWTELVPADLRAAFDERAGSALAAFGYPTTAPSRPTPS